MPLRELTLDSRLHPRGAHHISAASGLVCAYGRVYVIADDEHHLAVFSDLRAPGQLHRFAPGNLPRQKRARKRRKPDMETLLRVSSPSGSEGALVALGSGSRPNRQVGAVIELSASGRPLEKTRRFDLTPLYGPLRDVLGALNIEGALVINGELLLLNRGVAGDASSAVARFALNDLFRLIHGHPADVKPISVRRYNLGVIDGVSLAFTDGAAMPEGGWVFTAVAEDTDDSVADGHCKGSAVGVIDARGDLVGVRRLKSLEKVEGIDLRVTATGADLCMVTDSDDPSKSSRLLLAQL